MYDTLWKYYILLKPDSFKKERKIKTIGEISLQRASMGLQNKCPNICYSFEGKPYEMFFGIHKGRLISFLMFAVQLLHIPSSIFTEILCVGIMELVGCYVPVLYIKEYFLQNKFF